MEASVQMAGLIERDAELALLIALAEQTTAAGGRFAVIAGEAGIGKTALLSAARQALAPAGLRCLSARASELERGFAFGVVRQLLEPELHERSSLEREQLFAGAASLARPVFGACAKVRPAEPDPEFGILHGLYWLLATLARERPTVLLIDDIQSSDTPSLRFIEFLLRRLDGLPLLVLAALRSGESGPGAELVAAMLDRADATAIRPAALSRDGVAALVGDSLERESGEEAPSETLWRLSAGNPLYLRALLAELGTEASATLEALAERGSESIARVVSRRLSTLPPEATKLATAVAVLGEQVELRSAMALAGLNEVAQTATTIRALGDAAIIDGEERLSFTHPIVRSSLYGELREPERAEWHAAAARILIAAGAGPREVAVQLQRSLPGAVAGALELLRTAAEEALALGAPELAAAFLQRALAERLADSARFDLLLSLGQAELRAGQAAALTHLNEALEQAPDVARRSTAALSVARLLYQVGRAREGIELLDRVAQELDVAAPEYAQLQEEIVSLADLDLAARPHARTHVERLLCSDGDGALLCAHRAVDALMRGDDVTATAELAERALLDESIASGSSLFFLLTFALTIAERFDRADELLCASLDAARTHGIAIVFAQASILRAFVRSRSGNLIESEADVRAGLELATLNEWPPLAQMAVTVLIDVLIERGEIELVGEAAASCGVDLEEIDRSTQGVVLLQARGRLRAQSGDPSGAAEDLLDAGRHFLKWGVRNPALYTWRSHAALAVRQLGEIERADTLAEQELGLCRAWGAPRATGVALRAAGLIAGGERGLELLAESVAVLRGSAARLELARALADLGAALRRGNRRADAREPLSESLELARSCGAEPLAHRAHTELWATGARPREPLRRGVDALTPSERRVAELAGSGLSNPEIAQSLFVTIKTIETHLSRVYRKLDINSREELVRALSPARG